MDRLFLARIVLSFFLAGAWIALVTLLAERLGSRLGGLFSNLPSNILISLIFIAVSNDVHFVKGMMPAVPLGMLIDTVFLLVMMLFLKYGLTLSLVMSVSSWAVLTLVAAKLPPSGMWLSVLIYFAGTIALYIIADKVMRVIPVPGSGKRYRPWQIVMRAAFAGTIVGSVVMISGYLPSYLTGIISTFPAVLLSTMVILHLNQGPAFARATGKILILSSSNIIVYAVCVYYMFPAYGIIPGTVVSFLVSFAWVLLLGPVTGLLEKNIK